MHKRASFNDRTVLPDSKHIQPMPQPVYLNLHYVPALPLAPCFLSAAPVLLFQRVMLFFLLLAPLLPSSCAPGAV